MVSFGPNAVTRLLIPKSSVDSLPPEGYIIKSASVAFQGDTVSVYAADGVPPNQKVTDVFPPDLPLPNTGLNYGCYALLEELGFGFFQPLDPVIPSSPKFFAYVFVFLISVRFVPSRVSDIFMRLKGTGSILVTRDQSGPFAVGTITLSTPLSLRTS